MPKKIEAWTCNICGQYFDEEELARLCEFTHPPMVKTSPTYEVESKYPKAIHVLFDNGKNMRYERCQNYSGD